MSASSADVRGGERAGSFALQRAELAVADAVGELMELWGFRRQLGRIWAVLFLSERPLAAPDLCERLRISTGLLSMSLAELRRWGVVRSAPVAGDRKEHFEAETNIWSLVRRVLAERERKAISAALESVEAALREVKGALADVDPHVKAAARFRLQRLEQLAQLCRVGQNLLHILLESARVDIAPLRLLSEALTRR
ncbi:MAG TPA: MarR family transcriptional regulator [Anaeromyxobacteraceae bacterium]|nr:MarR family transcriptional regulator [Anaeromyxobacteraceae bacterium]